MATKVSLGADNTRKAVYQTGKTYKTVNAKFSITAANSSANDVYLLTGPLSPDDRIARIVGATPALTGATDNNLGFYTKDENGDVEALDEDVLWDGITLASAIAYRDLLTHFNSSLDTTKSIAELLDIDRADAPVNGIFLGLKTVEANTATGPLILDVDVKIEQGYGIL
jgi:hypothetical protein